MQKKQIILAILMLLFILLAFLGFIFRADLSQLLPKPEVAPVESPVEKIKQDTIPYKEYLKKELGVVEATKPRRAKREIWRLGKGPSIINYLLKAQKHIELYEGKILEMERTYRPTTTGKTSVFQSATIDFTDFKGDTSSIELQIAKEVFVEGSSQIAIAFQAPSLTNEQTDHLMQIDYPFSVLITPWEIYADSLAYKPEQWAKLRAKLRDRQASIADLRTKSNCDFVIWPFLESTKINSSNTHPIRIHHSANEIQISIREAFEMFPEAKGIATRLGEQAVEHRGFLTALLNPLKGKNLFFLDLTGTSPSETNNVCESLSIRCEMYSPYNPDNSTVDYYVTKTLKEASKYGSAVLILPASRDTWKNIENIKELASRQGTEIVSLTELLDLHQ